MNISGLTIYKYKSIKQPMSLKLLPVNIVIGQNNSGKSNILDAMEFVFFGAKADSPIYYADAHIEIDIGFNNDDVVKMQLPSGQAKLCLQEGEKYLRFDDKEIAFDKNWQNFFWRRVKRLRQDAFEDLQAINDDWRSLFKYAVAMSRFQESLRKHFPKINASENALDINYQADGLYEGQRRVTIDRLGQGFQRIFVILLYIFHPQYSFVMIDEPETHLHPSLVEHLLWAMQNSQAGQAVFTTHSPLFVTPVTLPEIIRVVKDEQTTIAYQLDREYYHPQRLIQELNADNLEMLFADEVVLVEGVSDRLLLRGLIDHFYNGDKDIKVIQTHGKGNMSLYVELLRSLHIPVIIVLDRDAIKTHHLDHLLAILEIVVPGGLDEQQLIRQLEVFRIFVFPNGDLEANYPRRYQIEDSKSLNALRAASLISDAEYHSDHMSNLRNIINRL